MKTFTLEYGGKTLHFHIQKRKGQKRFLIRPIKPNVFRVSTPKYMTHKAILKTVEHNLKNLTSVPLLVAPKDYLTQQRQLLIFNEPIEVVYTVDRANVFKKENILYVSAPTNEKQLSVLKKYLKDVLLDKVNEIHEKKIKELPHFPLEGVTFNAQYMSSKHGSCKPIAKEIKFNLMLVHYPLEYLQFIYSHEIVHLLHANHGQSYYQTLASICPHHKELKQNLTKHHTKALRQNS